MGEKVSVKHFFKMEIIISQQTWGENGEHHKWGERHGKEKTKNQGLKSQGIKLEVPENQCGGGKTKFKFLFGITGILICFTAYMTNETIVTNVYFCQQVVLLWHSINFCSPNNLLFWLMNSLLILGHILIPWVLLRFQLLFEATIKAWKIVRDFITQIKDVNEHFLILSKIAQGFLVGYSFSRALKHSQWHKVAPICLLISWVLSAPYITLQG